MNDEIDPEETGVTSAIFIAVLGNDLGQFEEKSFILSLLKKYDDQFCNETYERVV